jgi:hypothetical protein
VGLSVGEGLDAATAIEHPATASALHRMRWLAWIWLFAGVISFVGFTVGATVVGDRADRLRRSGDKVSAVVVYPNERVGLGKFSTSQMTVRFTYHGVRRVEAIALDDSSPQFREGQETVVYVDPADPRHLVIDGSDNQSPWTVWPMLIALIASFVLVPMSVAEFRRRRRWRRALTAVQWAELPADAVRISGSGRYRRVVLRSHDPDTTRYLISVLPWRPRMLRTPPLWCCSIDDRATIVSTVGGGDLFEFRRARTGWGRRRDQRLYDRAASPAAVADAVTPDLDSGPRPSS